MSIASSIISSSDDLSKPSKKSYGGYDLDVRLESVGKIRDKINPLPPEQRALLYEFSAKEPMKEFVILDNKKRNLGRLTTFQIKEIFDDIGFNVNPTFGGKHYSDFDAVMNINGYSIPGWVKFARVVSRLFPSQEKNLLRKLSPGSDRLHVRFFETNEGSWFIAAHTDHNWLSLNLKKVYKAHVVSGAGDYVTGTKMLYFLLKGFAQKVNKNEIFTERDIQKILSKSYNQSIVKKFGIENPWNLAFC